jgi:Flp pilus assembly protein TadB
MLTAKATVEKQHEQPNVTVQPMQKPAIITDIGMFAWLLGILQQNPIVIVIVVAVIAVLAYFGWNKRRY